MYSGIYEGEFTIPRRARKNYYEFYLTLSANRQHSPSESRQKSEGTLTTTSSPSVTGIPKE